MPGFPTATSAKFLTGLFYTPQVASTTDSAIQLYTAATAGTNGLIPNATRLNATQYGNGTTTGTGVWTAPTGSVAATAAGQTPDLYIGLIKGASGSSTTITDDYFSATGEIRDPGSIPTGGATGTGEADYSGYKRVRITSTPSSAGTGAANSTFAAITTDAGKSSISIACQLQFPANVVSTGGANSSVSTANTIIGFFISSNRQSRADAGAAPTAIDIIAYGSLSSTRSITANDTPVFTGSAITITLD